MRQTGPASALYVGYPPFEATDGEGAIVRIDHSSDSTIEIDNSDFAESECPTEAGSGA